MIFFLLFWLFLKLSTFICMKILNFKFCLLTSESLCKNCMLSPCTPDLHSNPPQIPPASAEDPSPGFAQLRDVVELSMCLKQLGGKEPVDPVAGLGKDTVSRLQNTLKINMRQLRRLEEIIVLHALDRTDPDQYKAFRVRVKKRLRQMYQVWWRLGRTINMPQ